MAACRSPLRSLSHHTKSSKSVLLQTLRFNTTTATKNHNLHQENHNFLKPDVYLGSWKPTANPKEAEAKLAQLRREYAGKVKELRKEYIHEIKLQMLEKQRQDEAKKEALRQANEERKRLKAAAAEARAVERKVAEEEFRQTLLKERTEKLANWRMKEKRREDRKEEKSELLRRQSSMWVDEPELEKKILEAIVDTTPL